MSNIWILFVLLLDCVPFIYFAYASLKNELRYPQKSFTLPIWYLFSAAVSCGFYCLTLLPFFSHDILRLLRLGSSLVLLSALLLSVKKAYAKTLFVFSLIVPFSLGFSEISSYISYFIKGNTPPYMVSVLIRTALLLICYPFMIWFWRKLVKHADRITDPTIWKYMWLIPATSALSEMLLMDRNFEFSQPSLSGLFGRIAIWGGSVAICWLLFFLAGRFELRMHLQDLNERNEMLLSLQKQQYIDLAESVDRARAARHDLRHHLSALKSMADSKEYDKLTAYISEIVGHLPSDSHIKICENYAANAVLDNYIRKARELNIPIKINFRLSNESGISDADLCVLLGNTIENAIEAVASVEAQKQFISINAKEENDRIYMTFDNSFDGDIRKIGSDFLSKKRSFSSTGIGITSIKNIVDKYNGVMKTETDNNIFRLSVMINKA